MKWLIKNFITGELAEFPRDEPGEPTQAWVDGWNAGMEEGADARNPHDNYSKEHHDWQDGWSAAMRD